MSEPSFSGFIWSSNAVSLPCISPASSLSAKRSSNSNPKHSLNTELPLSLYSNSDIFTNEGIRITLGNFDTTFDGNPPGFSSKIGSKSVLKSKASLKSFSQPFASFSSGPFLNFSANRSSDIPASIRSWTFLAELNSSFISEG